MEKSFIHIKLMLKSALTKHNLNSMQNALPSTVLTSRDALCLLINTHFQEKSEMGTTKYYRSSARESAQDQEPTDRSLLDAIAYSTYLEPEQELDFERTNNNNS